MDKTAEYMISLIRAAISRKSAPELTDGTDPERLFRLAKLHGIAAMLSGCVKGVDGIPTEIGKKFENEYLKSVLQQTNRDYEAERFFAFCAENGIDLLILKGFWLRELYPDPEMRSSCDIDIYVDTAHLPRVREYFLAEGFEEHYEGLEHDYAFLKKPYINFEIHCSIEHEFGTLNGRSPFELASPTDRGKNVFRLENEAFYCHVLGHMAKHFKNGGFGLRGIADLYLFRKRYENELDKDKLSRMLRDGGLEKFDSVLRELSDVWFGMSEMTDELSELADYVMGSGAFGTVSQGAATRIAKGRLDGEGAGSGKLKNVIRLAFPPYSVMKREFEWLSGIGAVALPFAWIYRAFRAIFFRRRLYLLKVNATVAENEIDRAERLYKKLGL